MDKPVVMVLGVTGKLGGLIAKRLQQDNSIRLRVTTRRQDQVSLLEASYEEAVYLDLDAPLSFSAALSGVDRLFILTGYTIDMLVQAKTLVDAAINAGVKHIVQLGVFTPDRECSSPHFAWHQLIQSYIRESGITWTFLHPNEFMQNLLDPPTTQPGEIRWWGKQRKFGWVALEDVAEAAAKILKDGPEVHGSQDYWFSSEVLNIQEVAKIIGNVIEIELKAPSVGSDDLVHLLQLHGFTDVYWTKGVVEYFNQVLDGRMEHMSQVRDDCPKLLGRSGTKLQEWALLHKSDLLERYQEPDV
jgi:NAD(P)H dehydrogenase (quinone)